MARDWESVIGLEIHARLATRSKLFSGSPNAYGAEPNSQASAVDLGLPGVLPVLNAEVVRMAVMFGLAIGAAINARSVFARKNYFYPDLPKGYQISQYELPVVVGGEVEIAVPGADPKRVGVTRAHLEEDAGKSVHDRFQGLSGIDLNRAGTPLIEIVSEPDMRSPAEAVAYMRRVHAIVQFLGICDGNMQEGSFRCDANVSVRPRGESRLGTRSELKNLNSFRFVERAIAHEIERQIDVLEGGGEVVQETRLYDPGADETRPMRSKEEANDYRYFPDPDLLPVEIDEAFVAEVRAALPELPGERRARFEAELGLGAEEAALLTASRTLADYFERALEAAGGEARLVANWIMGELSAAMNRDGVEIDRSPVAAESLGALVARIGDGTLSGKLAKQVFEAMWTGEGEPDEIIERHGLRQVTDAGALERLVDEALAANPGQVEQYRAGKTKVIGFLVGQVMKASAGKANPQQVNALLRARLHG